MADAEVGDDVYGEDPTVNFLQEYCADLLKKEAALFVSSGVMGNQLCLRAHTSPGDEVICERDAHILNYESGSAAGISGIQLFPISGINGVMSEEDIVQAIRPVEAYYMPRTRVIAIENTHNRAGGAVVPLEKIIAIRKIAHENGLYYHLDGARLWNACIATGLQPNEYAQNFDSVSVCLSKGLGAPVGSIVAGTRDFIKSVFRLRKAWGGGMRQVGILAAAAQYALQNNYERLAEDHEHARMIIHALSDLPGVQVNAPEPSTNIVVFEVDGKSPAELIDACKNEGVLISGATKTKVRALTHLDVSGADITRAIEVFRKVIRG